VEVESLWVRLRRRKVLQWGIAYAAGAWGLLQGLGYVATTFQWPSLLQPLVALGLLIGLPIVLVLAWYHGDKGQQRVTATELAISTLLFMVGGAMFWRYDRPGSSSAPVASTAAPLKCGRLEEGFLRVRCASCHAEKLVAFSCKKRGFCPSCGARRMAETAALLADEVLPQRPLRQWVLSLPHALRFLLATDADAQTLVLGVVYRTISRHLIHKAGVTRAGGATGAVTLVHPHVEVVSPVFHAPAPYGVYEGGSSSFANTVDRRYGTGVREPGCQYFATSAEAEAKRRQLIDTITRNLGQHGVYELNWRPDAAPAPQPKPAAPAATAAPQAPKPVAASATPVPNPPAAGRAATGVFVDCNGMDLPAGKYFFNPPVAVASGDANAWSASYAKYLLSNYKYDRNAGCTKFSTLAEAQSYYKETSDARRGAYDLNGKPAPLIITSWKYP
jgi:hypothetical protein